MVYWAICAIVCPLLIYNVSKIILDLHCMIGGHMTCQAWFPIIFPLVTPALCDFKANECKIPIMAASPWKLVMMKFKTIYCPPMSEECKMKRKNSNSWECVICATLWRKMVSTKGFFRTLCATGVSIFTTFGIHLINMKGFLCLLWFHHVMESKRAEKQTLLYQF